MTSLRLIFLAIIYLFLNYKGYIDDKFYYDSMISLFLATFVYLFILKIYENSQCKIRPQKTQYIFMQSIFYGFISIAARYLYELLIKDECSQYLFGIFEKHESIKYIPESIFIAGFVLLLKRLLEKLYEKCE